MLGQNTLKHSIASGSRIAPIVVGLAAAAMIGLSLWDLQAARGAVSITRVLLEETPITVYRPADDTAERPVVVIAHGFAGSQQLMIPFAMTLSRNGYLTVTFDFLGHGRNGRTLTGDITRIDGATRSLVTQTGAVADYALARYAQSDPRVAATVAVSMFSPAVSANSPPNLLIIIGELEGMQKQEALRVLGLVTHALAPASRL